MGLEKRPFDIIAIDGIDLDIVLKVKRLPGYGEKVMADLIGRLAGGPCANFACAAARIGMRTASLSTVGKDEGGQMVLDDFASYGVATDFIGVHESGDTPFTVILIEPDGERSIIVVPTFEPTYTDDELNEVFSQTRAIHTFPTEPAQFIRFAKIAHANQTKVMIDVEATSDIDREDLEEMLRWVDIASFNEQGFIRVSGEGATIDAARKLLAYGPETVVVTLARKGALAVTADSSAQISGHSVDVKDTTGAGDTFNAAFLSGTLKGNNLEQCLTFANAAAALSVTALGPRGGLPTVAQVKAFLEGNNT
ncbi:MAG: sugar/nucleoside kinase (ribokinase family) [Cellvibrionaceae bacterium]|jgi:sugar/nucleoside kinase (ribokinase family)